MTEKNSRSEIKPEMDKGIVSIIGPMDNNELKLAEMELFNQESSDKIADDFFSKVINPILSEMNFRK